MIADRDYAIPFLEQARADLRAASTVSAVGDSPSTLLMLIQMVFEKLTKAVYARQGKPYPKNSHQVTAHLSKVLRRHPEGKLILNDSPSVAAFIEKLEWAQPSIAKKLDQPAEQLEYPWADDIRGEVRYPEADLSLVKRIRDPKDKTVVSCLKVARSFEQRLLELFP